MDQLALEFNAPPQFQESLEAFLADKQAENVTPRTLEIYREVLEPFCTFLTIHSIQEVTPDAARRYVLYQQSRNLAEATVESRARSSRCGGIGSRMGNSSPSKSPEPLRA